jgi:molecular chaperone DnaK (HSP70)
MIGKAVRDIFPGEGKVRMERPNTAVAEGAALSAALIMSEPTPNPGPDPAPAHKQGRLGQVREMEVHDILTRSFGPVIVVKKDGIRTKMVHNLLFYGDPSPSEVIQRYGTEVDNQDIVQVEVYENLDTNRENPYLALSDDSNNPSKLNRLGDVLLPIPKGKPAGYPIDVYFKCDTRIFVRATDPETGEEREVTLNYSDGAVLSEEEFEKAKETAGRLQTTSQL